MEQFISSLCCLGVVLFFIAAIASSGTKSTSTSASTATATASPTVTQKVIVQACCHHDHKEGEHK